MAQVVAMICRRLADIDSQRPDRPSEPCTPAQTRAWSCALTALDVEEEALLAHLDRVAGTILDGTPTNIADAHLQAAIVGDSLETAIAAFDLPDAAAAYLRRLARGLNRALDFVEQDNELDRHATGAAWYLLARD
ncbi:MAG: hypothetical protein RIB84_08535 [Sneathiellaceae bacterium]